MAQSFYPNSGTIVNDALVLISATDPEGGVTPTTTQRTAALEELNYLVTSWQAHGMQVWCQKTGTYTLSNGVNNPTVGPSGTINQARPLSIQAAWLRDTVASPDRDCPIRIISREEYNMLSAKDSTGAPSCLFYDPEYSVPDTNTGANAKGRIYLWPTPDTAVATQYDLYFVYTRPIVDFSGLTDTLDFPQEWFNAIKWNLALALSFQYDVPIMKMDRIRSMAKETLDLALSWDRELVSVTISPAMS